MQTKTALSLLVHIEFLFGFMRLVGLGINLFVSSSLSNSSTWPHMQQTNHMTST